MKIINFISYCYIALGGAIGSVLRVYISSFFPNYIYLDKFPLPILLINIMGCFMMGVISELMGIYISANYNIRLFLISGLLGGFTTFSAFSLEFALLWQKNMYLIAISYCCFSFIFSITAFFIGIKAVKFIY